MHAWRMASPLNLILILLLKMLPILITATSEAQKHIQCHIIIQETIHTIIEQSHRRMRLRETVIIIGLVKMLKAENCNTTE